MRKTGYLICMLLITFSSCKKGELDVEPTFGKLTLRDFTGNVNILVTTDVDNNPPAIIQKYNDRSNILAGMRHFIFSEEGKQLLDTTLKIEELGVSEYTLFRQNVSAPLKIFNDVSLSLDTVQRPVEGYIKVRLVNMSKVLPANVDVHFMTSTFAIGDDRLVDAGALYNVSSEFTDFKEIYVGSKSTGFTVNSYTVVVRNSADKSLVATGSFALEANGNSKIVKNIYIAYLKDDGSLVQLTNDFK